MSSAEILAFVLELALHPHGAILFAAIVGTACALTATLAR